MDNFANNTSFQGVLDSIIRSYLLNELPPEVGESSNGAGNIRHSSAERDLGLAQAGIPIPTEILQSLRRTVEEQGPNGEGNNYDGQVPGTSASASGNRRRRNGAGAGNADQEYIKALHQCFEKRGVFKELQTFLRHKLVSILQDEFPSLQQSFEAKDEHNIIVFRLIEDFLRCHRLLYTLSVLASESDVKQQYTRVLYGKLNAKEAEDLLDELGISRLSRLSGQILKCYFDNEHFSLLESMHYLGIWLDGASNQQLLETMKDCIGNSNGKRKGSGQSIILTKSNVMKEPAEESEEYELVPKGNATSVDRRLIDLERRMEKENDIKLKEVMARFKSEEMQSLKEELERKMKLELVEKEKEHLIDMQSKLAEINQEIHQERQGWLEMKLRQEKELCELRKQLVTKTGKDISNANIQNQLESPPRQPQPSKSSQVSFKDESCNCRKNLSSPEEVRESRRSSRVMASAPHESTQEDKIVFLQYRLEQQDEEMKSLRRQLMISQYSPAPPSSARAIKKSNESRREGRGDADETLRRNENSDLSREDELSNGRVDDLARFLRDTRKRMEKLDVAASKVDEIVQEVFAKKRAATPLSSDLLSARLSSRMRKAHGSSSYDAPGIYNVQSSPRLLSPRISSTASLTPLNHQQMPEKQVTFVSTQLRDMPSYNNFDIFHRCQRNIGDTSLRPSSYMASTSQMINTIVETREVDIVEQERPQTPLDRQFPVSYGQQQQQKQTEPKKTSTRSDSKVVTVTNVRGPPPPKKDVSSSSEASSASASSSREQVQESLFHMAVKSFENVSPVGHGSTNLKEKAIRHGALSKEKVVTSDDDENSRSISVSESIKLKLASKSREALRNNNGNGSPRNGAISRSKATKDEVERNVGLPVKVQGGTSYQAATRRQSQSTPGADYQTNKLASSSSSSSHGSKKAKLSTRPSHVLEQENDLSVSSISISAPKSDNEGNNDDFWKL